MILRRIHSTGMKSKVHPTYKTKYRVANWPVLERNQIQPGGDLPAVAPALVEQKIISTECAEAFVRIWGSFRNDVHHMNARVSVVPFRELARRNMVDLAAIEREIFACTFNSNAKLVPVQPRYWDLQADGTASAFLRNPWMSGRGHE